MVSDFAKLFALMTISSVGALALSSLLSKEEKGNGGAGFLGPGVAIHVCPIRAIGPLWRLALHNKSLFLCRW